MSCSRSCTPPFSEDVCHGVTAISSEESVDQGIQALLKYFDLVTQNNRRATTKVDAKRVATRRTV